MFYSVLPEKISSSCIVVVQLLRNVIFVELLSLQKIFTHIIISANMKKRVNKDIKSKIKADEEKRHLKPKDLIVISAFISLISSCVIDTWDLFPLQ